VIYIYGKIPTKETCIYEKRPVSMKRDLYKSPSDSCESLTKETYICGKRPTKETCIYEKRPIQESF